MMKKRLTFALAALVLAIIPCGYASADARAVTELEVNTTYAAADICGTTQYFSVTEPGRVYLKLENCVDPNYSVSFGWFGSAAPNIKITNGLESAETNYLPLPSATQYSFEISSDNTINNEATFRIVYEPESSYNGESAGNDSFAEATDIKTNVENWGIGDYSWYIDYDYYHFTLDSPSQVSISLSDKDNAYYWDAVLYESDSSGETLLCTQSRTAISNGSSFDNLRLPAGSYYIRVYTEGDSSTYTGTKGYYYLTVSTSSLSSDSNEIEKNDLSSQANEIGTDKTYTGNINLYSDMDDIDWYKFTVSEKSYLTLVLGKPNWTSGSVTAALYLMDHSEFTEVSDVEISTGTSISSEKTLVSPGTYYVRMSGDASWDYTLNVKQEAYVALTQITLPATQKIPVGESIYLDTALTPSNASEQELIWSSSDTGIATVNEYGKVTAVSAGKATITAASANIDGIQASCTVYVTRSVNLAISSLSNTSGGIKLEWDKVSDASGYYIYRKTESVNYGVISTITSASTTSYTDKSVKNGTAYTYKVVPYSDFINGTGTEQKIVRVTGTKLSSVKKASSKKITVKWKKSSGVSGYQIQYSTSKSFSSGNKTKKVSGASRKKLKIGGLKAGTTYYVRIRAYRKVSGKTYYSAWSSKKSVKTTGSSKSSSKSSSFNKYWYKKYTYKSSSGTVMTFAWLDSGNFGIEFSGKMYGAYDFSASSYTITSDGYYFYNAGTYGIKYSPSKNAVLFIPGIGGSTWYYAK